jgi:alpha-D-xyloside xylohydrolase
MKEASENGSPIMRPMFYDFYEDKTAWETEDQYMFGPDILVAPVMEEGVSERTVYLPKGEVWTESYTGKKYEGGQTVSAAAPIDIIPVFIRGEKTYKIY